MTNTGIDFYNLLSIIFGVFFSLVIGFFVLEIVLVAISLATSYSDPKALENSKQTLTAAIKGFAIAVGGTLLLNTILGFLNIGIELNPLKDLSCKLMELENCVKNYDTCGTYMPPDCSR